MLLEIGLTVGLALAAPVSGARPEAEALRQGWNREWSRRLETAAKPEGVKWAPNRMKILLFQSKGRWVVRFPSEKIGTICPPRVEKNFCLPIDRTGL
jgi:hypothetical protein